jgi:hypothetical protein
MQQADKDYIKQIIQVYIKNDILDYWIQDGEMVYSVKDKYKNLSFEELNIKF